MLHLRQIRKEKGFKTKVEKFYHKEKKLNAKTEEYCCWIKNSEKYQRRETAKSKGKIGNNLFHKGRRKKHTKISKK